METIEKINKIKELIQDNRITIEKKINKSRKTTDPIKGTIRVMPEKIIENCIVLTETQGRLTVTHQITFSWSRFSIETIISFVNREMLIFNNRHHTNIKLLRGTMV